MNRSQLCVSVRFLSMNWIGGARNRIRVKDDTRQQRDFFEKRRFSKRVQHLRPPSPGRKKSKGAVSQDLIFLQALNNATARPRVVETNHQASNKSHSVNVVDLDSARPAKKRRIDVFLPNVSPDLARVPSRLELHEGPSEMRGQQHDFLNGSEMGLSTMEEPLPKYLRKLRYDMSKTTPKDVPHPICYGTEDEQVTPFLEQLLHQKPVFDAETPYNPYSAPGPASLKRRESYAKGQNIVNSSPVAGTIPEDLYPDDLYPDDLYPEDLYTKDLYTHKSHQTNNTRRKHHRTAPSADNTIFSAKSYIPDDEAQTHLHHRRQHKTFDDFDNSHTRSRIQIKQHELRNDSTQSKANAREQLRESRNETSVSSFEKLLHKIESKQIPSTSQMSDVDNCRSTSKLCSSKDSKWREFVTNQDVVNEQCGSLPRDERDEQLAEEALEELMKLSDGSCSGDEGGHSSDWSNSTSASQLPPAPKEDIYHPTHSSITHNKVTTNMSHPNTSTLTQSQHQTDEKQNAEDDDQHNKCHINHDKQRDGTTQTDAIYTKDVGTQSAASKKETRSIAIQTESTQTQTQMTDQNDQHLSLLPFTHFAPSFPHTHQLDPSLLNQQCYAYGSHTAFIWQSMLTKIVSAMLPSGSANSWLEMLLSGYQPSIQSGHNDDEHVDEIDGVGH